MNYGVPLLTVALLLVPGFSQSSAQEDAYAAQIPHAKEIGSISNPDELISYRFRLGVADADLSLVVVNKTDEPGKFLFQGLTSESESRPQSTQPRQVGAGESITVSAADLKWPEFECMYVLASRRIELRLVRKGAPNGIAIQLTSHGTVYDVASEQRLREIDSDDDFERSISLLGSELNPADAIAVKAHEYLPAITAQAFAKAQPADRSRVFLVVSR